MEAFETALRNTHNRFNALYGAARAAALSDNRPKAVEYYQKLTEFCRHADSVRPERAALRNDLGHPLIERSPQLTQLIHLASGAIVMGYFVAGLGAAYFGASLAQAVS